MSRSVPASRRLARTGVVATLVGLAAAAMVAGLLTVWTHASGPERVPRVAKTPRPLALVYRGPAGCPGCSEAVVAMLRHSPHHFRIRYVGPQEKRKVTATGLRGAALYVQPGGDGSVARGMRVLGPRAARAIKAWVARGGRYAGFCMGAYFAGTDPGIGLLGRGNTGQYLATPGAEIDSTDDTVIPVRWGKARRHHFAQDPPYIIASGAPGERVLSRFTNGRINALVRPLGHGAVGVIGTHPEAPRRWYVGDLWRQDRDGPDRRDGLALIHALMAI